MISISILSSGLLVLVVSISILLLMLSLSKKSLVIALAVIFLPFQQAVTFNVGATIRISDMLFIIIFISIIIEALIRKYPIIRTTGKGCYYYLYLIFTVIISMYFLKDNINAGISTLENYSKLKLLVNLINPIIAISAFFAGAYICQIKSSYFSKIINLWMIVMTALSVYIIIQFITINITGFWPIIPGESLNYNTSFAYGIRRAWGLSIEPGALANMMVFSLLIQLSANDKISSHKISIVICIIASVLTFSSIGLFSLMSLAPLYVLLYKKKSVNKYKVILIFISIIICFAIYMNPHIYQATIGKVSSDNFSKVDRQTNVTILMRMFFKYPVFGVGFGNYGALRNLFSYDTLFKYRNFYDTPNVFYLGIIAEEGIVGVAFFMYFLKKIYNSIKNNKKSPILFIIPFLILISTSSTITFNYMGFGFGLLLNKQINK